MSSPSPAYIVNVEAAILRDERYLIIQRGAGEAHAPGALSLPGGKLDHTGEMNDVLEAAVRREIREEVGVEVAPAMHYVESKLFHLSDGTPVLDVVFLCVYESGEASVSEEAASVEWLTAERILANTSTPPWTRQSILRAEALRRVALGGPR